MSKSVFTLLVALTTSAAAAEPTSIKTIDQAVEKNYSDLERSDGPGCAVGYARDGNLIYQRQFGMANLEHNIPINADTVFRVGSSSKQFVATSVAMLSLQGKLDLDADIHTVLPDLPDYGTKVTIRQMVNHSSGIQNIYRIMSAVYGSADGNFYPSEKTIE